MNQLSHCLSNYTGMMLEDHESLVSLLGQYLCYNLFQLSQYQVATHPMSVNQEINSNVYNPSILQGFDLPNIFHLLNMFDLVFKVRLYKKNTSLDFLSLFVLILNWSSFTLYKSPFHES